MAKPKKGVDNSEEDSDFKKQIRLISNLLALTLVKGETQNEKIRILTAAGYTPSEKSSFLGITGNAVRGRSLPDAPKEIGRLNSLVIAEWHE